MRLVFVDDSEQRKPARRGLGDLIAVGAVIVPDHQLAAFADRFAAIKADLGIPESEEIKWRPPRGSPLRAAGPETLAAVCRRMLEAAGACSIRSVVVVVDHSRVYTDQTKVEVGQQILAWLYERIEMHLDDVSDIGVVIADEPGGGSKAERRWLKRVLRLTADGTRWVAAENVVMPIVTAPSDHVPHLQLADLVTAATTAAVAGRARGLDLLAQLKALVHRRSTGECGGAGIVLYPPSLYDLYWWLFDEPHYRRGGHCQPLGPHARPAKPDPARPFLLTDGMPTGARTS